MASDHKKTNFCFYALAVILSVMVILFPPNNVLCYDVFGYYLYLPLSFKYHDLAIHNYSLITETLHTYHASETFYQAVKWDNGNWVMRYPIGMSIFYAPFYFIADLIAPHTSYKADGFSRPYQLSILYGCLIYTLIGLYFLKKILTSFFKDNVAALSLVGIVLATNYFFHVSLHGQGAMSHNILFSLYACILYLTIKWHQNYKVKYLIWLGIAVGMAALCRASEIISVAIPFFYGIINWQSFKDKLALLVRHKIQLLAFVGVVATIGFIQLGYYKSISGHFFINPYGSGNPGEGLELLKPQLLKVLFSFRKGWFIYTPLMVFVVFGFYWLFKNNKMLFAPVLIFSLINLYIVSSWSCWWFGSCFGNRALIGGYAVLSIPLGYCFEHLLKTKLKYLYLLLFTMFVGLNLFQSWQMSKGILDAANMSRAYYFSTFLQTKPPTAEQTRLLLKGKFSTEQELFTEDDALTHRLNFAVLNNFESTEKNNYSTYLCDSVSHSGKHSLITGKQTISEISIEEKHCDVTTRSYTWIKASVWVYSRFGADSLNAVFKINMKHKGWIFKPVEYKLNNDNFKPNTWIKLEFYYLTPDDLRSTKDLICVSFINKGRCAIYIDDLLLQSYQPIVDKSVF